MYSRRNVSYKYYKLTLSRIRYSYLVQGKGRHFTTAMDIQESEKEKSDVENLEIEILPTKKEAVGEIEEKEKSNCYQLKKGCCSFFFLILHLMIAAAIFHLLEYKNDIENIEKICDELQHVSVVLNAPPPGLPNKAVAPQEQGDSGGSKPGVGKKNRKNRLRRLQLLQEEEERDESYQYKAKPQILSRSQQIEKENLGYLRLTKDDQVLIGKYISPPKKNSHNFNIIGSIFFAFTISTTIGYGTYAPTTVAGKVVTCLLAVFGGAHFSAVFMVISRHVVNSTTHIAKHCLGKNFDEKKHNENRLCVLFSAMLLYLSFFSLVVCLLMEWPFFTSLYYSMITFTTVGLGFYAPSFSEETTKSDAFMSFVLMLLIILTLVGMALLAGLISELVADRYLYTKIFGGLFRFTKFSKEQEEAAKHTEGGGEDDEEGEETSMCVLLQLCLSLGFQMTVVGIILYFCEYQTEVASNAVAMEEYSKIGHIFYINETGVLVSPQERYIISTYLSIPTRGYSNWAYSGSLFYATTIFTTIGYGTFAPMTVGGKIATCFFAVIGVAHFGFFMTIIGDDLTYVLKEALHCCRMAYNKIGIFFLLAITFLYIFIGSIFFSMFVSWGFGNVLYFGFITFTTVGLGDFAPSIVPPTNPIGYTNRRPRPGQRRRQQERKIQANAGKGISHTPRNGFQMILAGLFLLIGLVLMAATIGSESDAISKYFVTDKEKKKKKDEALLEE